MPPRVWRVRVEDILEAIERVLSWTEGSSLDEFEEDDRTIQAVAYNLLIIGEAASAIPESVQRRYPEIPWAKMRGMRNLLAHEYHDVDPAIVWQTVQSNLPQLVPALQGMLDTDGDSESS